MAADNGRSLARCAFTVLPTQCAHCVNRRDHGGLLLLTHTMHACDADRACSAPSSVCSPRWQQSERGSTHHNAQVN
ncbi:hypothetical protein BDA96_04G040000 [Sorghum bicolor]|uniref:Uncharacterized protein n=2 Tax=Sorghum bicolor TaxID=4558 RepID=A0A921UHV7_SORBI|nr:hypothetical protein BDA96_04G040000 [Sorghum bicolor]OQU84338.1 hypothetical protein SORBI_3004G035750 [Sorghum bicolor]